MTELLQRIEMEARICAGKHWMQAPQWSDEMRADVRKIVGLGGDGMMDALTRRINDWDLDQQ